MLATLAVLLAGVVDCLTGDKWLDKVGNVSNFDGGWRWPGAAGRPDSVPISDDSAWLLLQENLCMWMGGPLEPPLPPPPLPLDGVCPAGVDKEVERKSDVLLYKPQEWRPALLLLLLLVLLLLLLLAGDVVGWLFKQRLPSMGVVLADETTGRQAIGLITPWPCSLDN